MKRLIITLIAMLVATAAAAQDGYRVKSGDTLKIEVVEDPSLNRNALVLPDGSINFPFAGAVAASGLTAGQIAGNIRAAISSNFASPPTVFVSVNALSAPVITGTAAPATIDIYFLGEWNNPGVQQVKPGTTLLQALSQGGGFTNFAATRRIQLRRTDPATSQTSMVTINYRALANGSRLTKDIVLGDGDVILAPERRLFE